MTSCCDDGVTLFELNKNNISQVMGRGQGL